MSLENLSLEFLQERYKQIANEIEPLSNEIVQKLSKFDELKIELESIDEELKKRYNIES